MVCINSLMACISGIARPTGARHFTERCWKRQCTPLDGPRVQCFACTPLLHPLPLVRHRKLNTSPGRLPWTTPRHIELRPLLSLTQTQAAPASRNRPVKKQQHTSFVLFVFARTTTRTTTYITACPPPPTPAHWVPPHVNTGKHLPSPHPR